jgi:hypothetical protein
MHRFPEQHKLQSNIMLRFDSEHNKMKINLQSNSANFLQHFAQYLATKYSVTGQYFF